MRRQIQGAGSTLEFGVTLDVFECAPLRAPYSCELCCPRVGEKTNESYDSEKKFNSISIHPGDVV